MTLSPFMLLHIITGSIAVIAGLLALILKKGQKYHRLSGKVFVISMAIMALSGAYIAYLKPMMITLIAGFYTLHLVLTAYMVVKTPVKTHTQFDNYTPLSSCSLFCLSVYFGLQALNHASETFQGFSHEPYFFFALLSAIALIGDIRLLICKGLTHGHRLARHIWRMCFALYLAIGSFFGQGAKVLPETLSQSVLIEAPEPLILLAMIFWLLKTAMKSRKLASTITTSKSNTCKSTSS
ncbi:hypothetical protein PCIT_b0453 [Pseudoalteromonas citrea]|uniref:DUF2306 domain-containing protein n=2 Tax=Pseudoalteromonas citrea TaxID=43655 RepID=A0AAD4FPY1_9GAMM|nr:DUF2306 domain-containing protein [Pseudoalteromonas citrea]KAF7764449.1 hypothetical protein PCIT_b0453 [Pseudoalteromonas citrea]